MKLEKFVTLLNIWGWRGAKVVSHAYWSSMRCCRGIIRLVPRHHAGFVFLAWHCASPGYALLKRTLGFSTTYCGSLRWCRGMLRPVLRHCAGLVFRRSIALRRAALWRGVFSLFPVWLFWVGSTRWFSGFFFHFDSKGAKDCISSRSRKKLKSMIRSCLGRRGCRICFEFR